MHPHKVYFQHYAKGLKFLGVIIKPGRIYIGSRVKGNFYLAIMKQNRVLDQPGLCRIEFSRQEEFSLQSLVFKQRKDFNPVNVVAPSVTEIKGFISVTNSYLGLMKHYQTYKLCRKFLLKNLDPCWWDYVYLKPL